MSDPTKISKTTPCKVSSQLQGNAKTFDATGNQRRLRVARRVGPAGTVQLSYNPCLQIRLATGIKCDGVWAFRNLARAAQHQERTAEFPPPLPFSTRPKRLAALRTAADRGQFLKTVPPQLRATIEIDLRALRLARIDSCAISSLSAVVHSGSIAAASCGRPQAVRGGLANMRQILPG
jgi:hypothetical protein